MAVHVFGTLRTFHRMKPTIILKLCHNSKNYENLDVEDNQMVDIELNYSQVTFMAKKSKTRKIKKTTR